MNGTNTGVNTVTRKVRSANRRAMMAWRHLRAGFVDTRISSSRLAAALGVTEQDLPAAVVAVRAALGRRLPVGPHDAERIGATLRAEAPGDVDRLASQANAILNHTFDLLGSGPVHFPERIDWHTDFKSGYRWNPSTHYSRIRFGDVHGVDVKVPWELSRGQHLPPLAQAYLLTGRSEYAREAVAQIRDWIATNPPEFGVNWVCPMDVAIRAVNWLWAAGLLSAAAEVDDAFFEELLASLLAHGTYLSANLELPPDGFRSNHYIADLAGLLYLGLCVPEFADSAAWVRLARTELEGEMSRQVLADGASYESSIPYHRLVTEMFLSSALLARHHHLDFPQPFLERLGRMVDFAAAYTKPNGLAPQIGDTDDGRLHMLTGYGTVDMRDHRHILAAGAALFDRADWLTLAGPRWIEALWFGVMSRPAHADAESPVSRAFEDFGLYILKSQRDAVIVTAGGVGTGGLGSHKHNDLLAIEVQLDGEDVLVDPGTYVYTPDPEARNAFRSTRAHNTVTIDDAEQNRIPASLFSLQNDASPRLIVWKPTPGGGSVTVEHDGYGRLPAPVVHRRTVSLAAGRGVGVEDMFNCAESDERSHRLCWTFVLAPGCQLVADSLGWTIVTEGGRRLRLTRPRDRNALPLSVSAERSEGFVSVSYGVRQPTMCLRWIWEGRIPLSVGFDLSWAAAASAVETTT